MKYVNIKNWEKFQTFKDRRPTWVKLNTDIVEEFDADGYPKKFFVLPDSAKLTFIMMLCRRSYYNKHIPYKNTRHLAKMLGIRKINLQPLIDKGFIEIDGETIHDFTEKLQNSTESLQKNTESDHQSKSKSKRESKNICTELFDNFWKAYPRKDAKGRAVEWFEKKRPTEQQVENMLTTIEQQKPKGQRLGCERQFMPLPTTWLNDGDWQDVSTQVEAKQKAEQQQQSEQQEEEKKRQRTRELEKEFYEGKSTEQLKAFLEEPNRTHWLITEILAERK